MQISAYGRGSLTPVVAEKAGHRVYTVGDVTEIGMLPRVTSGCLEFSIPWHSSVKTGSFPHCEQNFFSGRLQNRLVYPLWLQFQQHS